MPFPGFPLLPRLKHQFFNGVPGISRRLHPPIFCLKSTTNHTSSNTTNSPLDPHNLELPHYNHRGPHETQFCSSGLWDAASSRRNGGDEGKVERRNMYVVILGWVAILAMCAILLAWVLWVIFRIEKLGTQVGDVRKALEGLGVRFIVKGKDEKVKGLPVGN